MAVKRLSRSTTLLNAQWMISCGYLFRVGLTRYCKLHEGRTMSTLVYFCLPVNKYMLSKSMTAWTGMRRVCIGRVLPDGRCPGRESRVGKRRDRIQWQKWKRNNHAQCGRDGGRQFFGWVESSSREVVRDKDRNKGWVEDVDFELSISNILGIDELRHCILSHLILPTL